MARIASTLILAAVFGVLLVTVAGQGFGSPQSGPNSHPQEQVGGSELSTSSSPSPSTTPTVSTTTPSSIHNQTSSAPIAAHHVGKEKDQSTSFGSRVMIASSLLLVAAAPILM